MSMFRRTVLAAVATVTIAGLSGPARADKIVNKTFFGGIAIKGYDPVAYFKDGRPVEGRSEFTHPWMGAAWRFASAENRAAFAAQPETYAPQFGGYCASAVANNYTADIDPEAWRIVDGRLYLNYSKGIQSQWQQDIPGNISKGGANWPGLRAKLAE